MTNPNLVLLPWARRGGSLDLPADDPDGHPASRASATAEVRVNGADPPARVQVQLLGPGDVTSIAAQQVIRTDPAPNARTFESNYLVQVEFDEPALPWLFTPASAKAGRLRPWVCLVVVRPQPGVELAPPSRGALPVLRIGAPARPEVELPDLKDSWAWAHAQLATDAAMNDAALAAALGGDPARSLSRLLCGRLLAEQTEYVACVVPTFEAGRLAGLGDDPGDAEGPAWHRADGMGPVELPVFYSWRFATGTVRGLPVPCPGDPRTPGARRVRHPGGRPVHVRPRPQPGWTTPSCCSAGPCWRSTRPPSGGPTRRWLGASRPHWSRC